MARLPGPACDSCCAGCSVYDREKDAPGCWRVRFPVSSRPPEPLLLAQHYDVDDVLRLYVRVLNAQLELPRNLLLHQQPALERRYPAAQRSPADQRSSSESHCYSGQPHFLPQLWLKLEQELPLQKAELHPEQSW